MVPLAQTQFDVFALALPRGHGFGDRPPFEAWRSEDGRGCAILTRHIDDGSFGLIVMRRREDAVWVVVIDNISCVDAEEARTRADAALLEGAQFEPLPPGVQRRPALHDLRGREASEIFRTLTRPSHHNAAWLLNQLYLSLPRPDRNWAADCQTENFHARLWEAQLLASFREQGLLVTQPFEAPDFRIENRRGGTAWVEAVTANPQVRFEPVNAMPTSQPEETAELFFGAAALRFAKTIGNKLQRKDADLPHVAGVPFAIALADFHAAASMVWSREALLGYLYGLSAKLVEIDGRRVALASEATTLLGPSAFPAGLFRTPDHRELSAIIFTNACTLGKLNRVAMSSGASSNGLRYVRYGRFYDRTPGALDGIPFSLDVTSAAYRALWPQGYEPWSAELEVFHNPFARHPLPEALLPEATHWIEVDGAIDCRSHYATNILWSRTLIQSQSEAVPAYDEIPAYFERLGRRRGMAPESPGEADGVDELAIT